MSVARLMREVRDCQKVNGFSDDGAVKLVPGESDSRRWAAFIQGPEGTPYEKGVFEVAIKVPMDYPMAAVTASFVTKIFHPNVQFDSGEICLDILKNSWSPVWTLQSVCQAIRTLLAHPAADSPLNCDAGNLLRADDTRGFNNLAKMYSLDHAQSHHHVFDNAPKKK
eukprot:TRINITY_DN2702_c0_g1_i1.p3 TRINITY_DN2702_c0_g1~~TRINITY_DN2702_c0_g1_i1.p3  ORF type:complete len:167 (+),score=56.55 TRINITY_DN2702_c0_g1_i1:69-569(+)